MQAAISVEFLPLALLCVAAFCAGVVDAIAGGGGLITLPALLAAGLPPHLALGTNKGQSVFGALAATARFAHAGWLDLRRARWLFPVGVAGSLSGAALVLRLRPDVLKPIVLALLVVAGLFLALRRSPKSREGEPLPPGAIAKALAAAFAIAAYDGFFGPGTGTFLIIVLGALLHLSMARASAEAKVVNLASNVAALALFSLRGVVVWSVALPMAACQLVGGVVGAHLTVRGGDRLVRWVVLVVVAALVLKLGSDLFRAQS